MKDLCKFTDGLLNLSPERNHRNKAGEDMPPVLPSTCVHQSKRHFRKILEQHEPRILKTFDQQFSDSVSNEFDTFHDMYQKDPLFKEEVDRNSKDFNNSWTPFYSRFPNLVEFLGGLASVFPTQSSVEGDFSVIDNEKHDHRYSLKNVPLEGILHSLYENLTSLFIPY